MKNMTLENIAKACNGIYVGDEDLKSKEITGVEKDSRLIKDGYLYLPLWEQEWMVTILYHRFLIKGLCVLYQKRIWIILRDLILR